MRVLKRVRYNAPVTLTFALLSGLVLLVSALTGGTFQYQYFCVYRFSLSDVVGYFRLFSHVLGHANFEHYVGNMTLILILGPMLEEKYGGRNLLLGILATAFVTGVFHCALSSGGLLGASGIVFMMIMLASMASVRAGTIPLTLLLTAAIYIGGEVVDGLTAKDNISQLTHILGGVCGVVLGFFFTGKRR